MTSEKIAAEREDLAPAQRREVAEAGKRFRSQLETTARDVASGATSVGEAVARLRAALDDVAKSVRDAYAPIDC
jgi:hypothetical protein